MTLYDGNGNTLTIETEGKVEYKNPNLVDVANISETGYGASNDGYAEFGAAQFVFKDYIDVSANKEIYMRICLSSVLDVTSHLIACYDENKSFLYTINHTEGYSQTGAVMRSASNSVPLGDGTIVARVEVVKYKIPDGVKYIRCACEKYYQKAYLQYTIISYTDIRHLFSIAEEYPAIEYGSMLMIGDSLTNWAGGNDYNDGFLKVVHDKTGVATTAAGLAGAWWQLMDGESIDDVGTNGVGRVNAIIADDRKYDLYCFMLGSNAGSTTDTGETSADPSTMSGAIRYCMETLKSYDPTATILVCLPPQRAEGNESQEKVNAVIKAIVESYGVKTLDIYHHSGIVPNTKIAGINYLSDGVHLGDNGMTVLGKLLAAEVKYLLCL